MNKIIYKGLELSSPGGCMYYQVCEGRDNLIVDDTEISTLRLTYKPGTTNKELAELLGLPFFGEETEMTGTNNPVRFKTVTVTLNGLKLIKKTHDAHVINVVIVADSESRVVQDYEYTTIVVSKDDYANPEFAKYLFTSGNLGFLQLHGPIPTGWEFRNFPKIRVADKSLDLESESARVFTLRRRYDDYVIRSIDYQDQFILEIRRILEDYGIELVRINKEHTQPLTLTSYVTYQFTQTPTRYSHVRTTSGTSRILHHKVPVEFALRTPDMVKFYDFKNRYANLDLLTNFCEFKTTDKYGQRWSSAIKWSGVTEDFNQIYSPDDNSNFAWQCQFRCEIFFYEVFDEHFKFLEEIVEILDAKG